MLILLSDGKPEDRGEYRGRYGVLDAAMAVRELARDNVQVHTISLRRSDGDDAWLGEIFGPGRTLSLQSVDLLPERLPELFRGLIK